VHLYLLLHGFGELLKVGDLVVSAFTAWIDVVTEEETADVVVRHFARQTQMSEDLIDVEFKIVLANVAHDPEKLHAVLFNGEPVVEDSVHFVHPQPHQFVRLLHTRCGHEQNTANYAREVAEIEDVMTLGGGWQKGDNRVLVHLQRGLHHHLQHEQLTS
jgi:hypothetical protein